MTALPLSDSNFVIRKGERSDGEKIFQITERAFADYQSGNNPSLKETLFDIYQDIEKHTVLVVEKNELIVGSLRLEFYQDGSVYLKRFSISPEFQHQGLGTFLYKEAENEVKTRKAKYIFLYSSLEDHKLISFYRKLGFTCEETDNKYGYRRGLWVNKIKGTDH